MSAVVSPAGEILRTWRRVRRKSQLDLALDAGVSPRHLSFIETGRASPSREMLVALSDALDIPLRERNPLLQAAGYAALYRESPLGAPALAQVRRAIHAILKAHAYVPAILINARYDILDANAMAQALIQQPARERASSDHPPNLLRLLLSNDCLRPAIENWGQLAAVLIRRALREGEGLRELHRDLSALIADCLKDEGAPAPASVDYTQPGEVILPLRIRVDQSTLAFFTTITTLGTPADITLQELRIEAFHPADAFTEDYLTRVASASANPVPQATE